MSDVLVFATGGYRYIRAVFQYSGGIAAEPGYEVERARFMRPLPLPEAFAAIEAHLKALGRPFTAFAACELRSPAPFSDQGFYDFNKLYVTTLARWGIYNEGDPLLNPVARTNVCPSGELALVPEIVGGARGERCTRCPWFVTATAPSNDRGDAPVIRFDPSLVAVSVFGS